MADHHTEGPWNALNFVILGPGNQQIAVVDRHVSCYHTDHPAYVREDAANAEILGNSLALLEAVRELHKIVVENQTAMQWPVSPPWLAFFQAYGQLVNVAAESLGHHTPFDLREEL
jgi:hypothetical protein